MSRPSWGSIVAQALMLIASIAQPALAGDKGWPQWRGPTRDGVATGADWPDSLADDRLKLLWRQELGPSYSGPIVIGNRVFTTETRDEAVEVVTAFERDSGERLWAAEWPGAMTVPFFAASNGSWIRATPASDGESLFVAGIKEVLVSLDLESGAENWRIDFPAEYDSGTPAFGCASSPIVDDGFVYVQYGGGASKVDKATGEVVWRVAIDGGGMSGGAFSSPVIAALQGEKTFLVQARQDLKGLDPESGEQLWSQPIQAFRGMNIMTPTVYRDTLFTSAHTGRSQRWRVSGEELGEVWSNKSQAYMSSPVIVGEHLYLHLRNQRIQCLNLETGEEAWRSEPFGKYQSMVVLGDNILALDERGELILFRATPEDFEVIDRRTISEAETWAHLAVCGGRVVVRELNALAVYAWK